MMAWEVPFFGKYVGSMADFTKNANAWLGSLTSISQLDMMGYLSIGCALILIGMSVAGIMEDMSMEAKRR